MRTPAAPSHTFRQAIRLPNPRKRITMRGAGRTRKLEQKRGGGTPPLPLPSCDPYEGSEEHIDPQNAYVEPELQGNTTLNDELRVALGC